MRLSVAVVALLLLAFAAFEVAVRLVPYPPGAGRPPPASSLLLDRSGRPLASFAAADGRWHLPLADAEVSPHLLAAVVAVEDARFEAHAGVDWPAVAAAAGENLLARRVRRGGSTLTMQLQRLRAPRPRGWLAKLDQVLRARQIERTTTKRQILVEYVNRAPFGGGLVGAGAASWRYFGKPCRSLSLGESALLAGLPQNPNRLRPDRYPQAALSRRHHVLGRLAATGAITPQQQAEADAEPLTARWRPLPQVTSASAEGGERLTADGLLPTLLAMKSPAGGRVLTTIDADAQRTACALAADRLSALASSGVTAAAVVVLDTRSAECLAAVSLEVGQSQGGGDTAGRSIAADEGVGADGGAASDPLSPVLGGEGWGEGPSAELRSLLPDASTPTAPRWVDRRMSATRLQSSRPHRDAVGVGMLLPPSASRNRTQFDARPLTLALSPGYRGEGTGGRSPNDGALPELTAAFTAAIPAATSPGDVPGIAPPAPFVRTSALDLTRRPRSTGSVLKPFVYAIAFDAGIATPTTVLRDEPAAWPGYAPANYDRSFGGPMTAADALARSRNIPALLLLEQVGVERAVGVLDAVGIATPTRAAKPPGLSLAIGGADAAPAEVAEGFAALARGGVPRPATFRLPAPAATRGPTTPTLTLAAAGGSSTVEVLPAAALRPAACWATMRALAARDRTSAVCPEAADARVAWKTGTSSGHRDAWCAAAAPAVTVVVWLGNAGGQGSTALVGQDAAAPLALRLVAALDRAGTDWPAADGDLAESGGATRPGLTGPTADRRPRAQAAPRLTIVSPAADATVVVDRDLPAVDQRVALQAAWRSAAVPGDGGVTRPEDDAVLYWFVDGTLLDRGRAADRLWWTPTPGRHEVKVTDDRGRAAAVWVEVRATGG